MSESGAVLALDLGTTTGWAMRNRLGVISGTVGLRGGRYEGGGMRYLRFRNFLDEILRRADSIERIVFEEVRRHRGVDAAHVYGGMLATLTSWCEMHQIPYEGYPVGQIKRHATGSGAASKDAMVAAMVARGHSPADDNEADALACLYLAIEG